MSYDQTVSRRRTNQARPSPTAATGAVTGSAGAASQRRGRNASRPTYMAAKTVVIHASKPRRVSVRLKDAIPARTITRPTITPVLANAAPGTAGSRTIATAARIPTGASVSKPAPRTQAERLPGRAGRDRRDAQREPRLAHDHQGDDDRDEDDQALRPVDEHDYLPNLRDRRA